MSRPELFMFRLFVAGEAANSSLALNNLRTICQASVPDRFEIEVVDVFREPRRALADSVFMTPTVIKLAPTPQRRIVGTLTHADLVLRAFGLDAAIA
jgi:circadian clock protein KaiB